MGSRALDRCSARVAVAVLLTLLLLLLVVVVLVVVVAGERMGDSAEVDVAWWTARLFSNPARAQVSVLAASARDQSC
jgi:hypothetical protein